MASPRNPDQDTLTSEDPSNIFDKLPDEVLSLMLSFLPTEDLLNAELISTRWRNIIVENQLWKFHKVQTFFTKTKSEQSDKKVAHSKNKILHFATKELELDFIKQRVIQKGIVQKVSRIGTDEAFVKDAEKLASTSISLEQIEKLIKTYALVVDLNAIRKLFEKVFISILSLPKETIDQEFVKQVYQIILSLRNPLPISMQAPEGYIAEPQIKLKALFDKTGFETDKERVNFLNGVISLLLSTVRIKQDVYLDFILENHPQLSVVKFHDMENCSLLHQAISEAQYDKAVKLIQAGADVNLAERFSFSSTPFNASSPFHLALNSIRGIKTKEKLNGFEKLIEILIEKNMNPQKPSYNIQSDERINPCTILTETVDYFTGATTSSEENKEINEAILKILNKVTKYTESLNNVPRMQR